MFSGYQILKFRQADELRDIQWAIDNLNGKSFKSIALENNMSSSNVKRRIGTIHRRVKYRAIKFDKEKYEKVFYRILFKDELSEEEAIKEQIVILEEYKLHAIESIKNDTFYKTFKKDLPKKPKRIPRNKCIHCNGTGYFD